MTWLCGWEKRSPWGGGRIAFQMEFADQETAQRIYDAGVPPDVARLDPEYVMFLRQKETAECPTP